MIKSFAWADKSEYSLNEGRADSFGRPHNSRRAVHHETEITIRAGQGVENALRRGPLSMLAAPGHRVEPPPSKDSNRQPLAKRAQAP